MRVRDLIAPFMGSICVACCLPGAARAADPQAMVRAVVERNIDGWAKFNADEIAGTYADDATWQNPFGVRLHGPKQLKSFLKHLFARPGFRSGKNTSAPRIREIRMLGTGTAVVWSEETSVGQIENGKPLGPRHSHYLQVLRLMPAGWRITDDMIMDERELP